MLLIVISMKFTLFFVVYPALDLDWFEGGMDSGEFTLLVLATLFLAIGGYLINDFFDMDADTVNKPGKNLVGRMFSVLTTQVLYWVFTVTGVLLGVWLSYLIHQINYALIFLGVAGLLWFYSEKYQCQPLIGNLVISLLSGLSFGLVWLFEFFALSNKAITFTAVQANFGLVNRLVLIYMGFAFLVSLLREVVKDIEDFKGDDRFGCRTFAVVYGKEKGRVLALGIAFAGLLAAFWFQYYFFTAGFTMLFGAFFVLDGFFGLIIWRLRGATETKDYARISTLIKVLMLAGVLTMVLFYFEF